MNREDWLTKVAEELTGMYSRKGFKLDPWRITCGWPCIRALSRKARVIGQCHSNVSSKAGIYELFISPTLENPIEVAGTVAHELVHVAVGTQCGHKGMFIRACRSLGLVGKPTNAGPGDKLKELLDKFLGKLGPYPHQALLPTARTKLVSSSIKLVCECGCNLRISRKWLEESGVPTCGCGNEFDVIE